MNGSVWGGEVSFWKSIQRSWDRKPISEADLSRIEGDLDDLGAQRILHGTRRVLKEHLTETKNILQAWKTPLHLQAAGLYHSVYATEAFHKNLIPLTERASLSTLIGTKAERLVYLFCVADRGKFLNELSFPAESDSQLPMRSALPRNASETVTPEEQHGLILLLAANLVEQSSWTGSDQTGGLVSLASFARRLPEALRPKLFDAILRFPGISETGQRPIEDYNQALRLAASDRGSAMAAIQRFAGQAPFLFEPLIWLAYLHFRSDNTDCAMESCDLAREAMGLWGTSWDKRLTLHQWTEIAGHLRSGHCPALRNVPASLIDSPGRLYRAVNGTTKVTSAESLDPEQLAQLRLNSYIAEFADKNASVRHSHYPGLRSRPWHDAAEFPLAGRLEKVYSEIMRQVSSLDHRAFQPEAEPIRRTGNWDVMFLYERGRRNNEVCSRLSVVDSILTECNAIRCLSGLIYLSRLKPGARVQAHQGPTNMRLRCHLGLSIPSGDCQIKVDGEARKWVNGKCIIFDDSFVHEAWNNTDEERLVLIVDLWHSDLTLKEIATLEGLEAYAAFTGRGLERYWALNDAARAKAAS